MDTAQFDYSLPLDRIAQQPAEPRDAARLLVVDRATRQIEHRIFRELPGLLPPGTRLFRNHAMVFKARLRLLMPTGGGLECLLLNPELTKDPSARTWWCLLKPGRKFAPGDAFGHEHLFRAVIRDKTPDGRCLVHFTVAGNKTVADVAEEIGETPVPPYLHRTTPPRAHDAENYQTIYADPAKKVAAAAPTAGLHFTQEVLAELAKRGVPAYDVALRVGLDTFRPISVPRLEDHPIHREWYEIPAATRAALHDPTGGPRLAVGTTTARALEDYMAKTGTIPENVSGGRGATPFDTWQAEADLFIIPPRAFAAVDLLLTNFHLPRSTLLCLVSAFLTPRSIYGIAWLKEIYAEAIAHGYRFYSYGDAMLIR
jgi:S-adenosylmethionine:tRNA ribosyltransferase-isomerase